MGEVRGWRHSDSHSSRLGHRHWFLALSAFLSVPLLSQGPPTSAHWGMVQSCRQAALKLSRAPALAPSPRWSQHSESLVGLLPNTPVPYPSQLLCISPACISAWLRCDTIRTLLMLYLLLASVCSPGLFISAPGSQVLGRAAQPVPAGGTTPWEKAHVMRSSGSPGHGLPVDFDSERLGFHFRVHH